MEPNLLHVDNSSFQNRLKHFTRLTSPLNLLASNAEITHAQQVVHAYSSRMPFPKRLNDPLKQTWYTPEEIIQCKYLVDSSIHPDTQERILLPLRMSSFVPTNLIVTAGLLIPNPSIRTLIFWQWANQSVNVGINWANSNKTTSMSLNETAAAYGMAVTSSVAVALGMNSFVKTTTMISPTIRNILSRLVPFVAVASAGSLNVFLMRRKEITDGIDVCDEDGNVVGKSKIAGGKAVFQVAVSRIATAFPCLTLPTLILNQLEKTALLKARPSLSFPINLGLISLTCLTALPCAIALFPQYGTIEANDLEPEFHHLKRKDWSKTSVKTMTYNKGL